MAFSFRRSRKRSQPDALGKMWDAIVCTCQSRESANSFRKELLIRQEQGMLSTNAVVLAVDDPKPNIGSGSAALNAIICVTECLAAHEGQKVVTADILYNTRILILLLGSTFPFSPCGHAFMPDPAGPHPGAEGLGFDRTEVKTNFDQLMEILNKLCENTPPGVWVTSTDMVLKAPNIIEPLDLSDCQDGVGALTIRVSPEHAMLHGACRITESGDFSKIIHVGGAELGKQFVRSDGMCDMLSGIVYLSPKVGETMLALHTMPPLDACTYLGLDNGAQPLSLSLFFDILLCLTTEITKDEYITGQFKTRGAEALPSHAHSDTTPPTTMVRARALLWKVLKGLKMKSIPLSGFGHEYLRYIASDVLARYQGQGDEARVVNSILAPGTTVGKGSVIINCNLESPITVGSNCFLSGLSNSFLELQSSSFLPALSIPDYLTVQEVQVALGRGRTRTKLSVVVIYGINDDLLAPVSSPGASFCNQPWSEFLERTKVLPSELWVPNTPPKSQTLINARLFVASHTDMEVGLQESFWLAGHASDHDTLHRWRSAWRVSLLEILSCVDCNMEFQRSRDISFELQRRQMMAALQNNKPLCFHPFFKYSHIEHKEFEILKTLDEVVARVDDPLIICRIYSCIADVLGFMAGEGGIRGGPAANVAWRTAFSLLEKGNFHTATKALAAERANWIDCGPDRIIRASRHYERAGQILTRKAVATAQNFISGSPCPLPAIGQTITVYAPARVDLAGGWTDTPPQAYEFGGAVVTLALKINDEYPIKAVVERIPEFKLVLKICNGEGRVVDTLQCTELAQMSDYSQPHAPGALLKAAFICAGIVDFPSSQKLSEQLQSKYGSGFTLMSSSTLPQGSGLGTSSILGGAILAGLWKAVGQEHSQDSLIHAVLYLEQLLTTGGGWQDQCGGMYGGAKISHSNKGLPVQIYTKLIDTQPGFLDTLSEHLLLIYTGKPRLARNVLQDVLRNWHSRDSGVVRTMQALKDNAHTAAACLEKGDIPSLGKCLDEYQKQKLVVAPGSISKVILNFISNIRDCLYGCCLAGAGGGGFLISLVRQPGDKQKVKDLINSDRGFGDFAVYDSVVDTEGVHYNM